MNEEICSGGRCVLRLTCERFRTYREKKNKGKSVSFELLPQEEDGQCKNYIQIEFYGQ